MVPYHGWMDEPKVEPEIEWFSTSIWQKIVFFVSGQPVYKFQSKSFNHDFYNLRNWCTLIRHLNSFQTQFKIVQWADRGYSDYTKLFAEDQLAVNTLTLMK